MAFILKGTLADDYLFTLDICLQNLPANAHPAHAQRIRELKEMVQSYSPKGPNFEQLQEAIKTGLFACQIEHDDVEWIAGVVLRHIKEA